MVEEEGQVLGHHVAQGLAAGGGGETSRRSGFKGVKQQ